MSFLKRTTQRQISQLKSTGSYYPFKLIGWLKEIPHCETCQSVLHQISSPRHGSRHWDDYDDDWIALSLSALLRAVPYGTDYEVQLDVGRWDVEFYLSEGCLLVKDPRQFWQHPLCSPLESPDSLIKVTRDWERSRGLKLRLIKVEIHIQCDSSRES